MNEIPHPELATALKRCAALEQQLAAVRRKLDTIVVTEGVDKGVVLLSDDGPTHYDAEQECQVYDHEHFSPLGDALIEAFELTQPTA